MILSHQTLVKRIKELIPLENERDLALVNPASIDIRIGKDLMCDNRFCAGDKLDLTRHSKDNPVMINPGAFILASTLETLHVPEDLAMDLRLKSSRAREGWNHSMAFWFDPGWYGIGTLELSNLSSKPLPIFYGMKIAQLIYYELDERCAKPYAGRYQQATSVEASKA